MYSVKIVDGDIDLDSGGAFSTISGSDRIRQELSCWLLEPVGTDPLYKSFGSTLGSLVGEPASQEVLAALEAEVKRVVSSYVSYQTGEYNSAVSATGASNAVYTWNKSDILTGEYSLSTSYEEDVARISVTVKTHGGDTVTIDEIV